LTQRNTFWTLDAADEEQCIPRRGRAWSDLGSYPARLNQSCGEPSCEDSSTDAGYDLGSYPALLKQSHSESSFEDGSTEAGDSWSEKASEDTDFDRLSDAPTFPPGSFAFPPGVFAASPDPTESRTTLLLRNLPNAFRQAELMQILQDTNVLQHVDFLYLPTDFKTAAGLGYAFVNVTCGAQAQLAKAMLTGFSQWRDPACRKVLEVVWSSPHQGLDVLIEKYRNSRIMHPNVPDTFKPALLKDGFRVAFPPPTKRIRSPV
jgi:hypothetical protein